MNIGNWIVVAFVLFAVFIGTLVTICVRQDIGLVSKDYYKEELDYQNQINRLNNAARLIEKPTIRIVDRKLIVEFNQIDKIENGELKLFCPSNTKMDRNFKISSSKQTTQFIQLDALQKGMYRTKLSWTMNGKEYYQEDIIYI